jgi:AraC-like DNA-binding protein
MERFTYTESSGVTVLSACMTDFTYKRHAHEEYALGATVRGVQQFHLEGSLHTSRPGGVILFSPEQAHDGCAADRTSLEYDMAYVPAPLFLEAAGLREVARFGAPVVCDRALAAGIHRLARGIAQGRSGLWTSELLLDVVRRAARQEDFLRSPRPGRGDTAVSRAKEMLRAGRDGRVRLEDICQEVGMSKFHFIRHFKAATGISPYQFFLSCKVEHARQVVQASRDAYAAVADCGFVDLSHLNRHFKRVYGVTASEYARM